MKSRLSAGALSSRASYSLDSFSARQFENVVAGEIAVSKLQQVKKDN